MIYVIVRVENIEEKRQNAGCQPVFLQNPFYRVVTNLDFCLIKKEPFSK